MKLSKVKAGTSMRKVAGAEIPRINTTSKAMASAQKAASKSGWAGEEGELEVEGGASKPRLDRPMRKSGGRCETAASMMKKG